MNGDGGGGKLATALIVILVLSLFLFFAQLFYVIWRRRIFHRQTYVAGGGSGSQGDEASHYSSSVSNFTTASSSKELLYFLSLRSPDFRLDANSATAGSNSTAMSDLNSDRLSDFEAIDIDLLKLYGKFTPPRILFTIKEGQEKQAAALPSGKPLCPFEVEAKMEVEFADQNETGVCLENSAAVETEAEVEAEEKEEIENGNGVDVITPFSTPCGSPLYLTPTASPVHEKSGCRSSSEVALT